jgi:hypothetical protein
MRELRGDRVPVERAVTVGERIVLDDHWTRFFQRNYSTYRQNVRDSLRRELQGQISTQLHEDAASGG